MNDRALSILVHGPSKAGKSTFAVTAPYPRLLLDVEAASRFLQVVKVYWDPMTQAPPVADGTWDTCVVRVHDFGVALKAYDWLKSGQHPFRSVILDSISELQVKAQEAVNARERMQTQHWGELLSKVGFFGRDLRDLTTNPITPIEAVVITAMSKEKGDEIHKVMKPALQGQIADQVPYWYDITGYLFVDQEVDANNTPHEVRRLLTSKHPNFEAGSRVPGLEPIITAPNIETMLDTIFGPRVEA